LKHKLTSLAIATVSCLSISILVNCSANKAAQPLASADGQTARPSSPDQSTSSEPVNKQKDLLLGVTRLKTPIPAFKFGSGERLIIVLAGIHGDERSSTHVAEEFVKRLQRSRIHDGVTIIVVPALNPDGIASGTRTNSNEVDLNRNFPARSWQANTTGSRYAPGKRPGSEFETQALIKLLSGEDPALVISIHAPLNCINWDGPAREIAQVMSAASGFPLQEDIGYETPGSLGSYLGKDKGIPIITLELQSVAKSDNVLDHGMAALKAAITHIERAPVKAQRTPGTSLNQ